MNKYNPAGLIFGIFQRFIFVSFCEKICRILCRSDGRENLAKSIIVLEKNSQKISEQFWRIFEKPKLKYFPCGKRMVVIPLLYSRCKIVDKFLSQCCKVLGNFRKSAKFHV